ncbi:MAG: hypothetical protein LDL33_06400 [Desulfomonile sp.]|nr:hypothetical protein [Desulfomonile sp.]
MNEIGSGLNYRIAVDIPKNRLYTWFFGEIMRVEDNPELLSDVEKACRSLKAGFTAFSDLSGVKMIGLPDIAQGVQTIMLNCGVSKVASVWKQESFSKLVVDSSAQKAGSYAEKRKTFFDHTEAEAWLDGRS